MRLLAVLGFLILCGCEATQPDVQPAADILHYDLTLRINVSGDFEGRVLILVQHPDTLPTLNLSVGELAIDTVRLDGRVVGVRPKEGQLSVPLSISQMSHIEIDYRGEPGEGLYWGTHDDQQVLFTDSWPDRGRGWLPAVHHPADPATFNFTLKLPEEWEAVASGTLLVEARQGDEVYYQFKLEAPAPTYTFAFAVGDFAVTLEEQDSRVRHVLLAPDSSQLTPFRRVPEILAFFEEYIGPYAYGSYASVQVPIAYGGMENAAASFLNADMLHAGNGELTAFHEVAHQWFGNRVVIAGWSELWLSEGFAHYLPTLFIEHADGIETARTHWIEMAELPPERLHSLRPLVLQDEPDPNAHLSWVVYEKGASVLHLLRLMLGDDAFFRVLKSIYRDFAGRSFSSEDLRYVLESESGRDLMAFFDFWVYGNVLPTLRLTWDENAQTLRWQIEGDEGTLEGVPMELQITQGREMQYVNVREGKIVLRSDTAPLMVKPVGVMMRMEGNDR